MENRTVIGKNGFSDIELADNRQGNLGVEATQMLHPWKQ